MKITGKRIGKAFKNLTPDIRNTVLSERFHEKGAVIPMTEKKSILPLVLKKIAATAAMIVLLACIGFVGLMILNGHSAQHSNNLTDPTIESLTGKAVFNTENIQRITLYTQYGTTKISDVPPECMEEIKSWLNTFVYGEIAYDILPPGTDTVHIEIEYADGIVMKQGMNTAELNGVTYYIEGGAEPTCYEQLLSDAWPIALLPMANYGNVTVTDALDAAFYTCIDNYAEIKDCNPDFLSNLKIVTPSFLRDKCSIYRFGYDTGAGEGETFLLYDGVIYRIGIAFGGYGVTEFAYVNHNGIDILYFIYSWGSGVHRSHIGAFDFSTKQILDYTDYTEVFWQNDITFHLSEDGRTLGIANAQIRFYDSEGINNKITKYDVICEDISIYFTISPN